MTTVDVDTIFTTALAAKVHMRSGQVVIALEPAGFVLVPAGLTNVIALQHRTRAVTFGNGNVIDPARRVA